MKPVNTFELPDIRCGTIISCKLNEKAQKPAYVLELDFGDEIGVKKSSAQLTELYTIDSLIGTQVLALINIAPKRVAGILSEVLVLGFQTSELDVVLIRPDRHVLPGTKIS